MNGRFGIVWKVTFGGRKRGTIDVQVPGQGQDRAGLQGGSAGCCIRQQRRAFRPLHDVERQGEAWNYDRQAAQSKVALRFVFSLSKSAHTPSASGFQPEECDGTRVPYSATGGGVIRPGDLLRGLLGSRMVTCGSQDLAVRWLPSGTRVRRFLFPVHALASRFGPEFPQDRRDHTLSRTAASGTTPLLTLCRERMHRASRNRPLDRGLPSRRRPLPRQVSDPTSRQGSGRPIITQAGDAGISQVCRPCVAEATWRNDRQLWRSAEITREVRPRQVWSRFLRRC
jgi:hypothetical protein